MSECTRSNFNPFLDIVTVRLGILQSIFIIEDYNESQGTQSNKHRTKCHSPRGASYRLLHPLVKYTLLF